MSIQCALQTLLGVECTTSHGCAMGNTWVCSGEHDQPRAQGLRLYVCSLYTKPPSAAAYSMRRSILQTPGHIKEQKALSAHLEREVFHLLQHLTSPAARHSCSEQHASDSPSVRQKVCSTAAAASLLCAHRALPSIQGAVTLPLTPSEQHYFIVSARHNLLLEFNAFISAL